MFEIKKGQKYKHYKTNKTITVLAPAKYDFEFVEMLHESGRRTKRQRNIFLHDWLLVN